MLRPQGPAGAAALRRGDLLDALHEKTETAADDTTRRFLRAVLAQVRRTLTGNPAVTAAGEPVASDLFGLGQARGWWADAVDESLVPVLREVWEAGYSDTTTVASSDDAAAEFLARVKNRLSPTASPGLPDQAFELARRALAEELATGSSIPKVAERLAAEFSWDDPAAYWRRRKTAAQAEIDTILDAIGRPGEYAREQAKRTDPRVKTLRKQSNEATKRIDDVESTWKARATRIARTEATGAFSAGSHQAYRDEQVSQVMWVATRDTRTRTKPHGGHKAADGQIRPLGTPFDVGGEKLMFPGDPNGHPGNVINCRCTTVAVDTDAKAGGATCRCVPKNPGGLTASGDEDMVCSCSLTDDAAAKQATLQAKMEAAARAANDKRAAELRAQIEAEDAARAAEQARARAEAQAALQAKMEAAAQAANEAKATAAAQAAQEQAALTAKQARAFADPMPVASVPDPPKIGGPTAHTGGPPPAAPKPPVAKFGTPKSTYDKQVAAFKADLDRYEVEKAAWDAANAPHVPGESPDRLARTKPGQLLGMKAGDNRNPTWANKTMPRFDDKQVKDIATYTGDSFKPWNNVLRKAGREGTDPTTHSKYGALTKRLDAVLDGSRLPETIKVHRATSTHEFAFPPGVDPRDLTKLVGTTQVQDGYLSTAIGAKSKFGGDVHITFIAPQGTPMAWVDPYSKFKGENEMLGARGLRYVIHSARYHAPTKQWRVEAEILPVD